MRFLFLVNTADLLNKICSHIKCKPADTKKLTRHKKLTQPCTVQCFPYAPSSYDKTLAHYKQVGLWHGSYVYDTVINMVKGQGTTKNQTTSSGAGCCSSTNVATCWNMSGFMMSLHGPAFGEYVVYKGHGASRQNQHRYIIYII